MSRDSANEFANLMRDLCRSEANNSCRRPNTRHVAVSHDDTSEGAVHVFEDENGQMITYTFGEQFGGIDGNLGASITRRKEGSLNPLDEQNKSVMCAALRYTMYSYIMHKIYVTFISIKN